MTWMRTLKRRLVTHGRGIVVLMLATACGGGDSGPAGPGGNNGGGNNAAYDLVAVGRAGLPAAGEVEDCGVIHFYSGRLQMNRDGAWQIHLSVHDDYQGDWAYEDVDRSTRIANSVKLLVVSVLPACHL